VTTQPTDDEATMRFAAAQVRPVQVVPPGEPAGPLRPSTVRRLDAEKACAVLAQLMALYIADARSSIRELSACTGMSASGIRQLVNPSGSVASWQAYLVLLDALYVDRKSVATFRDHWRVAAAPINLSRTTSQGRIMPPPRPQPPRSYQPTTITRDEEIRAATPAEFAGLLRMLRLRSGIGATEVSRRSDIARSQVYELSRAGRTSLPTRSSQVVAYARACGLSSDKIGILTSTWGKLAEQASFAECPPTERQDAPQLVDGQPADGGGQAMKALADEVMNRVTRVAGAMPTVSTPQPRHRAVLSVMWVLLAVTLVGVMTVVVITTRPRLTTVVETAGFALVPTAIAIVAALIVYRGLSVLTDAGGSRWYGSRLRRSMLRHHWTKQRRRLRRRS
jgi:hypothetical protein